jgi:hypothetical protein
MKLQHSAFGSRLQLFAARADSRCPNRLQLPALGTVRLQEILNVSKPVKFVRILHNYHGLPLASDRDNVKLTISGRSAAETTSVPWAMEMKAVSIEDPSRLVQTLTVAILGCGGWVLSRGANDTGTVNMLFEFERQACVDIYSLLIAAGLELSQNGHVRFTELCQCTRSHPKDCGTEVASIDLEIQTFPVEMARGLRGYDLV